MENVTDEKNILSMEESAQPAADVRSSAICETKTGVDAASSASNGIAGVDSEAEVTKEVITEGQSVCVESSNEDLTKEAQVENPVQSESAVTCEEESVTSPAASSDESLPKEAEVENPVQPDSATTCEEESVTSPAGSPDESLLKKARIENPVQAEAAMTCEEESATIPAGSSDENLPKETEAENPVQSEVAVTCVEEVVMIPTGLLDENLLEATGVKNAQQLEAPANSEEEAVIVPAGSSTDEVQVVVDVKPSGLSEGLAEANLETTASHDGQAKVESTTTDDIHSTVSVEPSTKVEPAVDSSTIDLATSLETVHSTNAEAERENNLNGTSCHEVKARAEGDVSKTDDSNTGEDFVTLQDIMEAQEKLEEEAEDLLGGESGNTCTYPQGYKPRQPLYSCRDCVKEGTHAGICYGCSINCHDGHDLVELYTKRNFCCDCGNSKFNNLCKLYEEKKPSNERNEYNHNFDGVYCKCKQPYTGDEDMFQCCVCEDWFHLQHLADGPAPQNMECIEEIICGDCAERLHFLRVYTDVNYKKELLVEEECTLKKLSETAPKSSNGALGFRSYRWRERLCKCRDCLNLYEDLNVAYLTDTTDCVEEFVINNRKTAEPKSTNANEDRRKIDRMVVETVGRETAITLFAGFEEMKQKVVAAMKRAADEGREVRKEDINAAFEELETARKRRRMDENSD